MELLLEARGKQEVNERQILPNRDIDLGELEQLPQKKEKLTLNKKDYDDLIEWKLNRSEQQRNRSKMFFFIGLTISLLLVLVAFEWRFVDEGIVDELTMVAEDFDELQEIPQTLQPPPPLPEKVLQQPTVVEVPDDVILEEIDVQIDVEVTEEMIVEEIEFIEEPLEEEKAEEIFTIVEERPEPVGGMSAFYKYVAENIDYPRKAKDDRIQGKVFVQFVVNSKGEIEDAKVLKGIGYGCDIEAARIVGAADKWKPGKQRGKAVSVYMVLPITFKLAD